MPPSARVMVFAAMRIVSSSLSMSRSCGERDADRVELLQALAEVVGARSARTPADRRPWRRGCLLSRRYLMQTARTCSMSVMPSRPSPCRPSSGCACRPRGTAASISATRACSWISFFSCRWRPAARAGRRGPCSRCRRTCRSPSACRSVKLALVVAVSLAPSPCRPSRIAALRVGLEARGVHQLLAVLAA